MRLVTLISAIWGWQVWIIFLYSIKLKAFFTLTVSTCILPFALLAFVNYTAAELLAAPYTPDIHKLQMDIAECTEVRRAAGDALPVVPGNTHINKVMYPAAPNFTMWNYIIQVKLLLLRKNILCYVHHDQDILLLTRSGLYSIRMNQIIEAEKIDPQYMTVRQF